MKQANTRQFIAKICLTIFVIVLVLNLCLTGYEKASGNLFYFCGISSRNLHWLLGVMLLISGIFLLILVMRNRNLLLCILIAAGVILVLIAAVFPVWILPDMGSYVSLSSPDGTHKIIARELSMYHNHSVAFYQVVNPFFMRYKGKNQKAIREANLMCDGHYTVIWEESSVTISLVDVQNDSVLETVIIALN